MSKVNDFIRDIPSTQIRILFTVAVWVGTAIWVWAGGVPPGLFLGAIIGMSGLDAAQHYGKRVTEHKPEEVARAEIIRKNGAGHDPSIERNDTTEDERG